MSIRTIGELNTRLSQEFIWRRNELHFIKKSFDSNTRESERTTLARLGVVFLYAHWEGFIKQAAIAYLEFLSTRKIYFSDLNQALQALVLKNKHYNDVVHKNATGYIRVLNTIEDNLPAKKLFIACENWIDTKSNLKSEEFREIVNSLGLHYSNNYRMKENQIDKVLAKRRNEVAHGRYLDINKNDLNSSIDEIFKDIESLMEEFKNSIENAAVQKSFKNTRDS